MNPYWYLNLWFYFVKLLNFVILLQFMDILNIYFYNIHCKHVNVLTNQVATELAENLFTVVIEGISQV